MFIAGINFSLHFRLINGDFRAYTKDAEFKVYLFIIILISSIEILVYSFMGLAVALGGLIMITRIDSTQATIGTSMEIHVIAAVIIGGTSLFGGKGTVYGTLMGAILLSMMTNALVIAGVDYFWQLFIMGIIVLIAVTINNIRDKRFLFNSKL